MDHPEDHVAVAVTVAEAAEADPADLVARAAPVTTEVAGARVSAAEAAEEGASDRRSVKIQASRNA